MAEIPEERSALQKGTDWVVKHWPRVRLAHEGVMVDRIQRVQRIGEIAARNAATGQVDDMTGWPGDEEGDAMGVAIGDRIINHHYYGQERREGGSLAEEESRQVNDDSVESERENVVVTDPKPVKRPETIPNDHDRLVANCQLSNVLKGLLPKAVVLAALLGIVVTLWVSGKFTSSPSTGPAATDTDTTRKVEVSVDKYVPGNE